MRDALGPGTILGYCTNVHAGHGLAEMRENLRRHAVAVKRRVCPNEPMGVGLWFSATAARQLLEADAVRELRDWLSEHGLLAYTLNGFPHGDFHEPVVKHRVYEPDWSTPDRLHYTLDLVHILTGLLPDGADEGSISTLPIGWPTVGGVDDARLGAAAANLHELVHALARVELDTGRLIHVDLEPEPGCLLDTADDVVAFFKQHLLGTPDDVSTLAYLRVCHDICHGAVMFEPQATAIDAYRRAGIKVGKVQVSSALVADGPSADALRAFDEPRYLHQTTVRHAGGYRHYEDLGQALAAAPREGEWRVHFHVPLYLERIGDLRTTQPQIAELLDAIRPDDEVHHFEVETYAWGVLPAELQAAELSDGIAEELRWLKHQRG
jgi:hypothetical protein